MIAWSPRKDDVRESERQWRNRIEQEWLLARMDRLAWEAWEERAAFYLLLAAHKQESRDSFRRPPKHCGRGLPPPKKWGPRKR